jgi:hypothetical protein
MRTYTHLMTAACLAASAFLYTSPASAETVVTEKTTVTHTDHNKSVMVDKGSMALPAGVTTKDLNAENGVERAFAGIGEYAFSKTGFDNIVGYLVDQDRDRIKKSTDKTLNNLDGNDNSALKDIVAKLEGSWNKKYGKSFDIDHKKDFGGTFLHIMTGEVTDPSLLVGKWPVGGKNLGGKVTASDAEEAKKNFGGDVNLEKGRNVAVAHVKASHGMPGVTASLISEATGWRFDVPNNIDAQTLYNNVVSNLTHLNNQADKWPADMADGNRAVTHAMVSALYGIVLQKMPKNMTAHD